MKMERSLIYLTLVQVKSHRLIAYTIKTKEPPANQALLLTLASLGSLEVFFLKPPFSGYDKSQYRPSPRR